MGIDEGLLILANLLYALISIRSPDEALSICPCRQCCHSASGRLHWILTDIVVTVPSDAETTDQECRLASLQNCLGNQNNELNPRRG